jgi:hypothetical protein
MVHENELIMIVIGMTLLIFVLLNYHQLKQTPSFKLIFISFFLSVIGWISTVLEGLFWEQYFNLLEHFCYAASAILLARWCWVIPGVTRGKA